MLSSKENSKLTGKRKSDQINCKENFHPNTSVMSVSSSCKRGKLLGSDSNKCLNKVDMNSSSASTSKISKYFLRKSFSLPSSTKVSIYI